MNMRNKFKLSHLYNFRCVRWPLKVYVRDRKKRDSGTTFGTPCRPHICTMRQLDRFHLRTMQLPIPSWYRTPLCQVALVGPSCSNALCRCHAFRTDSMSLAGFTLFCTPGMFNAVSNLGAGGTEDIILSDMANGVHYGLFSIMGLFAGGVTNCAYASIYIMTRSSPVEVL